MINPSKASRHVLGVYRLELVETVASVAKEVGYTRALIVHGMDGMDEISLLGKTRINEINNGNITSYEIAPEDFGLERCRLEDIATGTPQANAVMIRDVFSGKDKGARHNAVVLNAAGALMIGGKASSFKEGIKLASEIIAGGKAEKKLNQLIEASHAYAAY